MLELFLLFYELEPFSHLNLKSSYTDLPATFKNSQLGFLSLALFFFEIPDACMVKKIFSILRIPSSKFWNPRQAPMLCTAVLGVNKS